MRCEILIYNKTRKKIPKKFISDIILGALRFIKIKQPVEMAVLVVDKSEIKILNKTWRKKKYIPDELSFGLNSRKMDKPAYRQAGLAKKQNEVLELGEIVINGEKISNKNNLAEILIHGLLHLLGYSHEESVAKAKKMDLLEKKLLKRLNI